MVAAKDRVEFLPRIAAGQHKDPKQQRWWRGKLFLLRVDPPRETPCAGGNHPAEAYSQRRACAKQVQPQPSALPYPIAAPGWRSLAAARPSIRGRRGGNTLPRRKRFPDATASSTGNPRRFVARHGCTPRYASDSPCGRARSVWFPPGLPTTRPPRS